MTSCARTQAPSGPVDACVLLPKNAAEASLGIPLRVGQSQGFGENARQAVVSNCLFVSETPEKLNTLTFTIRTGTVVATDINPAARHIATLKQEFGERYGVNLKKVDGVGRGAVWDDSAKQLTVFFGQDTYAFNTTGSQIPDVENRLIELAKKTIAKG